MRDRAHGSAFSTLTIPADSSPTSVMMKLSMPFSSSLREMCSLQASAYSTWPQLISILRSCINIKSERRPLQSCPPNFLRQMCRRRCAISCLNRKLWLLRENPSQSWFASSQEKSTSAALSLDMEERTTSRVKRTRKGTHSI